MDQKIQLIAYWLTKQYSISELSRMFEISRKITYKWIERYQTLGEDGLKDFSRAPRTHPNATSQDTVQRVIKSKLTRQRLGPKRLVGWLRNEYPELVWPAPSTVGEILKREGLVKPRKKRPHTPPYTAPFLGCNSSNDVWSIDYKGQFRMGDGRLCYPLTLSDNFSRYLLLCRGLYHPSYEETRPWLEWIFREYGLPKAIRSDNGSPFASLGVGGLSRLSVWWVKLGIIPERIAPGHPEQNGRHERMHRTLKGRVANPPGENMKEQQREFDRFRGEYNNEDPHGSLGMKVPASVYTNSEREYPEKVREVEYAEEYEVRRVRNNGQIKWKGGLLYVSEALIGEPVGLKQVNERYWEIRFSFHLLGYLDSLTGKIVNNLAWQEGKKV